MLLALPDIRARCSGRPPSSVQPIMDETFLVALLSGERAKRRHRPARPGGDRVSGGPACSPPPFGVMLCYIPPIRPGVAPAGSILCCPSTITTGRTGSRPPPGFSGVRARRMRMRAHAARLPPLCPTGTLATSGALRTSLDPSSWPHAACGRGCASAAAHPLARPRTALGGAPTPQSAACRLWQLWPGPVASGGVADAGAGGSE